MMHHSAANGIHRSVDNSDISVSISSITYYIYPFLLIAASIYYLMGLSAFSLVLGTVLHVIFALAGLFLFCELLWEIWSASLDSAEKFFSTKSRVNIFSCDEIFAALSSIFVGFLVVMAAFSLCHIFLLSILISVIGHFCILSACSELVSAALAILFNQEIVNNASVYSFSIKFAGHGSVSSNVLACAFMLAALSAMSLSLWIVYMASTLSVPVLVPIMLFVASNVSLACGNKEEKYLPDVNPKLKSG